MITIEADDYVVGIWFLAGNGEDWMACIKREGDNLCLRYRFRYYADDASRDPFDGSDEKNWYAASVPDRPGAEAKLIETVRLMVATVVDKGYLADECEPWECIVQGRGEIAQKALMSAPFAHLKYEQ